MLVCCRSKVVGGTVKAYYPEFDELSVDHRISPSRHSTHLTLIGLLLLGLVLRVYTIGAKTIWLDEAFSIWLANQPLLQMWGWLIRIDQHPPLYYTLLHSWQVVFGDLQGAVRLLSALCSTFAIPFVYGAARRLIDRPTAMLTALLLATAPFHVRYAQEARMYALLTLTVAIALYLLARLLTDNLQRAPRWLWPAFGVAQAMVMLTHNTAAVFFPLALNLAIGGAVLWLHRYGGVSALIALNRPGFERRWLRTQLVALACWLPWSIPFVIQSIGVDREFWIPFPTTGQVYNALHTLYLAHQPGAPIPWLVGDLFYWSLAIIGIWALRRRGALLALLLALFFVPIGGELLVSLRRPIFSDRTLIWITVPYFLLVAVGIRHVGRGIAGGRWRDQIGVLLALLLIALHAQSLTNYYRNFTKEGWDQAAAYVAAKAEPGDLILFNATWVQLPFDYYFRHFPASANEAIVRHGVPVDLFDRGILEPKMTEADLPRLQQMLTTHPQIWLIYSHDWYTDPEKLIPQELGKHRVLVATARFPGVAIVTFRDHGP